MSHLDRIMDDRSPKKLLSIDGGGIRGLIAIEFLMKVESQLRTRLGGDLVLGDYFDYVGGTSTGAIIASLIALGHPMEEIRDFYLQGAAMMFEPANVFQRLARKSSGPMALVFGLIGVFAAPSIFTPTNLSRAIREKCGAHTTLGSDALRTLLMIVMRNASTDSPWWISNNPRAKFARPSSEHGGTNLDLPLWKLVRASTAAPIFFPPEEIHVPGLQRPFVFQDGGVTVYNNPAFHLFLMSTLPEYELAWPAGEENILLVSVGTGLCESENLNLRIRQMKLLYNVQDLPAALMRGATNEQDLLCRVFGKPRASCRLPAWDSEIGTLAGNVAPVKEKLFSYVRYNVELSAKGLSSMEKRGLLTPGIDPKVLQPLDGVKYVRELQDVGKAAAADIAVADFEGFLTARGMVAA